MKVLIPSLLYIPISDSMAFGFGLYLSNNHDRIGEMHWRQFEKLTAEFYDRDGYKVELGPGSDDDGVDVRVWKPDASPSESPLCIVQCKRQKDKIEKVVVKGLHADIQFEQAEYHCMSFFRAS